MKNLLTAVMFISFLAIFGPDASGQSGKAKDEAAFRQTLKGFKAAVTGKDLVQAEKFLYFPLFTGKSDEAKGNALPADPVTKAEFHGYRADIFHNDLIRILPELDESSLSEIEGDEDTYYAALRNRVDQGSKLYELYAQYPEKNGNSESYFAFLFGRIEGRYMVIAYYGKWPVR